VNANFDRIEVTIMKAQVSNEGTVLVSNPQGKTTSKRQQSMQIYEEAELLGIC
jgi:hypothetical protein